MPTKQQIFAAWYERDYCDVGVAATAEQKLNQLLDELVAAHPGKLNRHIIKTGLWAEYNEFRIAQKKEEQRMIAQMKLEVQKATQAQGVEAGRITPRQSATGTGGTVS